MRVRPSVGIGIGLAAAYMAVFGGLFKLSGVDYDVASASADNMLRSVVIPVGITLALFVVVTSVFGWWKPVMRERRRVTGWLIAVPIIMAVALIATADYGNLAVLDRKLLLWIAVGTAFVGLSEELMYRGLLIVSFRSSMSEMNVWLWSSVAFGLLHSINALLGQSAAATAKQVLFTFLIGSGMYIARRTTGWIVVPMVLHAAWDFTAFTKGAEHVSSGMAQLAVLIVVVIALVAGHRRLFDTTDATTAEATS